MPGLRMTNISGVRRISIVAGARPLRIAVPKGSLNAEAIACLEEAGLDVTGLAGGALQILSKKYYFFDKEVGCLTASHSLSAGCGQLARLQAEKYFLRRTYRRRK